MLVYFGKLLKYFNNSPYLGYMRKQVHKEPANAYLLTINQIYKQNKSQKHVSLRTKKIKSVVNTMIYVNKTIEHVNKIIHSVTNFMKGKELESIN